MLKNILVISHKSPYTKVDGGVLAIRNLFEGLNKQVNTEIITLSTKKHKHNTELIPEELQDKVTSFSINTDLKFKDAFVSLVKGKSYNLSRFYNPEIALKIKNKINSKNWDVIILESLFSAVYLNTIKKVFNGKVVLRSHNVEHVIWDRLSQNTKNPLKKWYLNQLAKSLKKEEIELNKKVDAVFSISNKDLEYYKLAGIKNCFLLNHTRKIKTRKEPVKQHTFFHLASMDWQPNIDAVDWFVENVWKEVFIKNPSFSLILAGKKMPKKYFDLEHLGIKAKDYVKDGDLFMQQNGVLIVPLFSGSGVRIKVIDALATSTPIISTKIGIEGLNLTKNVDYLQADNAEEFIRKIEEMNPEICRLLIKNSSKFAQENFESEFVYTKFLSQIENL